LVAFPDERVEVAERKNFYPGSRKNLKKVEGVRSKRAWCGASSEESARMLIGGRAASNENQKWPQFPPKFSN
jgi:hypothetical protein